MGEELVLSPEELFCLGSVMHAEYIDYAYIAAMEDIGSDHRLFAKETAGKLAARGVLQEDFSGDMELDPAVARLLRPLFFGDREMTLDVCRLAGDKDVTAYKFHFLEGEAVMATGRGGSLNITPTSPEGILELAETLYPQGPAREAQAVRKLPSGAASRLLVFKSVRVGERSARQSFVEAGGVLYRESGEDSLEPVTKELFVTAVRKMLEEV